MAPSLEEPVEVALEHPLKQRPELVAPEPGMGARHPEATQSTDQFWQNTVPALNQSKPARETPAMAAPINRYAHPPQRAPTQIFLS